MRTVDRIANGIRRFVRNTAVGSVTIPSARLPLSTVASLWQKGSYTSPVFAAEGATAAFDLCRALEDYLGDLDPQIERDVSEVCLALARGCGVRVIDVVLSCKCADSDSSGYSGLIRFFHVDTCIEDPMREFIRLVKVYSGGGTETIDRQFVDIEALDHAMNAMRSYKVQRPSQPTIAHREAAKRVVRDRSMILRAPNARLLVMRCGMTNGLVHRAPPVGRTPRIVLSASAALNDG